MRRKQLRSFRAQELWRILRVNVGRVQELMYDFDDGCSVEDDEGGRSKIIDSIKINLGRASEHEVLPDFDAPQPDASKFGCVDM